MLFPCAPLSAAIVDFILVCLNSVILKQPYVTGFLALFARFKKKKKSVFKLKGIVGSHTLWSL